MSYLFLLGFIILESVTSHAQTNEPSGVAAGTLFGTGVVSGLLGLKYQVTADEIRAAHIKFDLPKLKIARAVEENEILKITSPIKNGDEIVIQFHYSPAKNALNWVQETRKAIEELKNSAEDHEYKAKYAVKDVRVTSRPSVLNHLLTEPDVDLRLAHKNEARAVRAEILLLENKIRDVQNGIIPAPLKEIKEVIVDDYQSRILVTNFMKKEAKEGSKFFYLTRLPKAARLQERTANGIGRGLYVLALVGTGAGVWELMTGEVSRSLNSIEEKFSTF